MRPLLFFGCVVFAVLSGLSCDGESLPVFAADPRVQREVVSQYVPGGGSRGLVLEGLPPGFYPVWVTAVDSLGRESAAAGTVWVRVLPAGAVSDVGGGL